VLHTVMRSVEFEEKLAYTLLAYQAAMKLPPRFTNLPRGPRATVMLRCSQEESRRIRTAAASGVHGAFQMLIIGAVPLSAEMFAKSSMSGCRRKFLPRIFSVSRCSICSAFLNPWGISPAGTPTVSLGIWVAPSRAGDAASVPCIWLSRSRKAQPSCPDARFTAICCFTRSQSSRRIALSKDGTLTPKSRETCSRLTFLLPVR
jgi:hypothetical protein